MSRHRNRRPKPLLPIVADDVKHPPLKRWQARFALWYAEQPKQPTVVEQVAAATRLASAPVEYYQLQRLKVRRDWRELHDAMARGGIEAARAVLLSDLPRYMELHSWAAQRAKEKDDVRAMAALTTPALDRVLPKRDEILAQINAPTIVIALSERQLAYERAGPIAITSEAIPNPHVPDDVPSDLPKELPTNAVMPLAEAMRLRRDLEKPAPPVDLWKE